MAKFIPKNKFNALILLLFLIISIKAVYSVADSSFNIGITITASDVQAAYNNLTADTIKKNNPDLDNVVSDLNLIGIGSNGTTIRWASTNSTTINPFSGIVTRPSANGNNKAVNLTANISKTNQTSLSKRFNVTVLKESITDASAVTTALNAITMSNILLLNNNETNITTNLNLSTTASNSVTLNWSSSYPSIIETSGSVSRASSDTSVTLIANARKNLATGSKSFSVTVKGTTDSDLIDLSNAKLALTDSIVLNGNIAKDNIIADLYLPANLSGHGGVVISWISDNSAIATNGTVTRSTTNDIEVTLTANFTKNAKSTTKDFILTVKKAIAPAEAINNIVAVSSGETEIVVDTTNIAAITTIKIPSDISENTIVSLNLNSLMNSTNEISLSTNNLTLSRNTSDGVNYEVTITNGSVIKGPENWNGVIDLPTLKSTSDVTPTAESGVTKTVDVVIEVGFSQGQLNFTKAAQLTIPSMAGKKAGYTDANSIFYTIPACTSAQANNPDSLATGADCYTSSGADMVIWTKHFTKFAAYTETTTTPTPEGGDGGGGGGGGGGGSTGGAQILDFTIDKKTIKTTLKQGQTKEETVSIKNIGGDILSVRAILQPLREFIFSPSSDEVKLTLNPNEEQTINLVFGAKEDQKPDIYTGEIIVKGGVLQKMISMIVEIESAKPLFDVDVEVMPQYKSISPGDDVLIEVSLFNVRGFGRVDVALEYSIKDFKGNLIAEEHETVAIETQAKFSRELLVPSDVKPGEYVASVKVTFEDSVGLSSDTFEVKAKAIRLYPVIKKEYVPYLLIAIALIIGISVFLISKLGLLKKVYMPKTKEEKKKMIGSEIRMQKLERELSALESAYNSKFISEESYKKDKERIEEELNRLRK